MLTRSARLALAAVSLVAVFALASCTPGQTAADEAVSQIGVPYVAGGKSPRGGFDCSGLTSWAWAQADVTIPRSSAAQYAATQRIKKSELEAGDLVFWGYDGVVGHVAIYVGNDRIVHARKAGTTVEYQSVDWWATNLIGYGRVQL